MANLAIMFVYCLVGNQSILAPFVADMKLAGFVVSKSSGGTGIIYACAQA